MSDQGTFGGKRRRRRGGTGATGSPTGYSSSPNTGGGQSPGTMPSVPTAHSTRDPSHVFPAAPYVPIAELTIQQQLREQLAAQPPKKGTTVVAATKFSHYLTISNLEAEANPTAMNPEYRTQTYHTVNRYNGKHVMLRRFVDPHITPDVCASVFENLRHFRHPNLVALQGIVPTSEFVLGHNDVLVEYRYIRGARTLSEAFVTGETEITEALLWSIACQLTGLIRAFHEAGTPLRGLHLTKVLYLDIGQRVMFSGLGFQDLIGGGQVSKDMIEKALRADVISLGLILLKLATKNAHSFTVDQLQKQTTISPVLLHFITTCVEGNSKIEELCRGLGERLTMEVGQQLGHADFLMHECSKELHNGRLMKLLIKVNFAYAATSDASTDPMDAFAIRSLFQHLFNQVDDKSLPKYDWGHVYYSLNKLDTRSEDVVQLISENDCTLLVISWRDLRTLLDRVTAPMTVAKTADS